jgi:hypothetical protein
MSKGSVLFGPHGPYPFTGELEFLRLHGLPRYSAKTWERTLVGEVKMGKVSEGQATVRIWVTCSPAKFWEFEVTDIEGVRHHVRTGSGCITDFWPSVKLVAMNMLVVRSGEGADHG